MLDQRELTQVIGSDAYAESGEKIGKVGQVYVDDDTSEPTWATVHTGLLGLRENFIPLQRASYDGDHLVVPFDKDTVKDAPAIDPESHLDASEEQRLYQHYGLPSPTAQPQIPGTEVAAPQADVPRETSQTGRDDAMTVSEERLRVDRRHEETGRARLRKYVTTEEVTTTVPVRKERAVLEHEPITDENLERATAGPEITESQHEVTLHEERPVVTTETAPVERVRLRTEDVTDEQSVTADVRKEHVDVEGDVQDRR